MSIKNDTTVTTLPNGLRVASQVIPRVSTAAVGVWVDVGSRHEDASENGVAHLLEHMAFKGTPTRSARRIAEEIEDVGGALNAYTSREHTAYHARLLADDVPLGVELIADILRRSTFDEGELEKERQVVVQEIAEVDDTPGDLVFDLHQEAAYADQPLGRSILGPPELVGAMPRSALTSWVGRHYAPQRMVLSAAGKVDHDALVKLAERHFGDMERLPDARAPEARYTGGETLLERDAEQVNFCLGLEAFGFHDDDLYALQVLSAAFGGGMSSRLFQKVREDRGLCYTVHSFAGLHVETGMFGVHAGTGEEQAGELIRVVTDELLRTADGFSDAETARAKAQLKAGVLMGAESCSGSCEDLARQLLMYGDWLSPDEIAAKVEAVTTADLKRVALRLLRDARPAIAVVGPREGLPKQGEVARLLG